MKDNDLFNINKGETHISLGECQLKFAVDKECKLYNYEKKVGIYFKSYINYFDNDYYYKHSNISAIDIPTLLNDETVIKVDVLAYNFDTTNYDSLGEVILDCIESKWSCKELLLSSSNIDSNSNIKLKFTYQIISEFEEISGFLHKRTNYMQRLLKDNREYILETTLLINNTGNRDVKSNSNFNYNQNVVSNNNYQVSPININKKVRNYGELPYDFYIEIEHIPSQILDLTTNSLNEAINVMNQDINNTYDLLLFFSAANYIKALSRKKLTNYDYKSKVEDVINNLINSGLTDYTYEMGFYIYYEFTNSCTYISFDNDDLVFVFKGLNLNESIEEELNDNANIDICELPRSNSSSSEELFRTILNYEFA